MRVLIFGGSGQLGGILAGTLASAPEVTDTELTVASAPRTIDIRDAQLVGDYVSQVAPDWVVNAAAMTQVDRAHSMPDLAMAVNANGAANIARAAQATGSRTIQISTEAVFDGEARSPYSEEDPCRPVSVYGVSKLAGEQLVTILQPDSYVLRTSWLYSGLVGANFPTRLLEQLRSHQDPVPVVDDLFGNPTPATLLSQAIARVMSSPPPAGTYHVCCTGIASKYEWAVNIAESAGYPSSRILPVPSSAYPTPAKRPLHVDLSCDRFLATGLLHLPTWQQAAAAVTLPPSA